MSKQTKEVLMIFLNGALCLLLTISLSLTCILSAVGFNLNKGMLNKHIIASGYNNIISSKILDRLNNYADINNLPHEIFDGFIGIEYMSSDIYEYIVAMSDGKNNKKYINDINNRRSILASKVKQYVSENMDLTDEQKATINDDVNNFVDKCATVYINNLKSNILEKSFRYINFIDKYITLIIIILLLVDCLLIYTLVSIQKWKHKGYRYILYSLIGSELTMIALAGYFSINNIINRIAIVSQEIYSLVTTILKGCLLTIYISILILAVLIVLDIILYVKKRESAME